MRNRAHSVALSAISAALAAIFLIIGKYVPVFELTAYMAAEIAMMIPLSKNYYTGGFLACIASGLIALLLTGGDFILIMPFVVFFGLHPLINKLAEKFNINKVIAFIVKMLWFTGTLFLMYFFAELFIADKNKLTIFINEYYYILLPLLGGGFFVFYEWFIRRAQRIVGYYINKLRF